MRVSKYVLFEPGGRQVSGYSYGKLVERRYIDIVRAGVESTCKEEFLNHLRDANERFGVEKLRECRVGYVDDNGAGVYFDALEFLENEGNMHESSESPT